MFPEGEEEEVLGLTPQRQRGGGINLPQDAGGKGCPLAPCPFNSVPGILGPLPATWQLNPSGLQVQFPKGGISISSAS